MKKIVAIVRLLRIKQYAKNLFIFIPLYFSKSFTDFSVLGKGFLAFAFFSLIASSIYVLNDILDADDDTHHPKKKYRPIASRRVSSREGWALVALLFIAGIFLGYRLLGLDVAVIFLIYWLLNVLYCIRLKHIAIVDVMIVSSGFVIRLLIGSELSAIPLSSWIIIMVFMLSFLLGIAKRRDDVLIFNHSGAKMRRSIDGYNLQMIDLMLAVMCAVIIVSYLMYTLSPDVMARMKTGNLYFSAVFVIAGIFRYLQQTVLHQKSGSPTDILYRDRVVQLSVIGWLLYFGYYLYGMELAQLFYW